MKKTDDDDDDDDYDDDDYDDDDRLQFSSTFKKMLSTIFHPVE